VVLDAACVEVAMPQQINASFFLPEFETTITQGGKWRGAIR
jgi:hypothetical protein